MHKTFCLSLCLILLSRVGVSDDAATTAAPRGTGAAFTVPENSPAGTLVGTVTSEKTTKQQRSTFAISAGNENGVFAIHPKTGKLTVRRSTLLDFETRRQYVLQVQVRGADKTRDSLGDGFAAELRKSGIEIQTKTKLLDQLAVTVHVADVNEPPTVAEQTFTLPEHSPPGTLVGRVAAADPDAADELKFLINNDNADSPFAVNPTTGEITVRDAAALDFEAVSQFEFNVVVIDQRGATASQTLVIQLTNINEPPQVADSEWWVPENSAADTFVGGVAASDPDAGDTLTYSILAGNDDGAFAIDESTGELRVSDAAPLDYETAASRDLLIQVTDADGATATAIAQLELIDVNEPPSASAQLWNLPATFSAGANIGNVNAFDPDRDDELTFAITAGNDDGAFAIDRRTGELTAASPENLNDRSNRQAALTVTVTDRAGAATTAVVSIDLGLPRTAQTAGMAAAIAAAEQQSAAGNVVPPATGPTDNTPASAPTTDAPNNADAAAVPVAAEPSPRKRAIATWILLALGLGATAWGALLIRTSLKMRKVAAWQQQALAAVRRDEEFLQDRLVEMNGFVNELRAERDELMATRQKLTNEFTKLKHLLQQHTVEVKSAGATLQHGDELLAHCTPQTATATATATATTAASGDQVRIGDALTAVRRELADQQSRLDQLRQALDQRDRDLEETCISMDARLHELLARTPVLDTPDLAEATADTIATEPALVETHDVAETAAPSEWTERQSQIEALERQFERDSGEYALQDDKTGETLPEEPAANFDDGSLIDDTEITEELQEKWAARSELNNLRKVANSSTRSVLARYSRKKKRRSHVLLAGLVAVALSLAGVTMSGVLGSDSTRFHLGYGALGVAGIAIVVFSVSVWGPNKKS